MFTDDLILVTNTSRKNGRNFLSRLNLYHKLTGQKPNLQKSAIFLSSWCNSKIAKAISKILGIKLGNFPFTYLGIPISPRKLSISQLNFLPTRVHSANHS